jgi:replicative DNA helicase
MSTPSISRVVLGSLYAHPEWVGGALPKLDASCFALDKFDAALYANLVDLYSRGVEIGPLDAVNAAAGLDESVSKNALREVGMLYRLAQAETAETFDRRVTELRNETFQRIAREGMHRIMVKAEGDRGFDWVATLERATERLRHKSIVVTRIAPMTAERVKASVKKRRRIIPTGFPSIDEKCAGFIVGKMTVIEARTNVGKSSMIAALAYNQFFAYRTKNIEERQQAAPAMDPFDMRRMAGHPQPKSGKVAEPHVLILSVEDDVDDYIGRCIVDMANIYGQDYLRDPEAAIAEREAESVVTTIADVLGSGRLTIADYEHEDGHEEKTLTAIVDTIKQWTRATRSRCAEQGNPNPPLLVFLDYFQKIDSPEDEKHLNAEHRVLAKISKTIYRLAKKEQFALVLAVMLLRGPDSEEPDKDQARGGSDVIQDADMTWTLWPFGSSERRLIESAVEPTVVFEPEDDEPGNGDNYGDDYGDDYDPTDRVVPLRPLTRINTGDLADPSTGEVTPFDDSRPSVMLARNTVRRAVGELLVTCDKNRQGQAGWRVPLYFDRAYQRITESFDNTIYRYHADIARLLQKTRPKTNAKAKAKSK